MTFIEMRTLMLNHFKKMVDNSTHLYEVNLDKDKLWDLYLESFPPDKNKIYRERREHDCSCCRHFIKAMGGVVSIENNTMISIWDFDIDDDTYTPSIKAMREYIHSCPINNFFLTTEKTIGCENNREMLEDGKIITYDHFYANIPDMARHRGHDTLDTAKGQLRDTRNVFKASLDTISTEAIDIVLELISQGSLYRGEENKANIEKFKNFKIQYETISNNTKRELFAWENSEKAGNIVGRIKNHAIGTLLVNISENMDLDTAVRKYEEIVAPSNYKRPKAIYTKRMLKDAKNTLTEMGYIESLNRRFATLDDITVNNILFTNKDSAKRIAGVDVFDEMASNIAINPKKFSKVEEIGVEQFINEILPSTTELEILFETKLKSNLVSLIAPENKDSKTMFKWNNNFCWAYTGNITDSMKERVKAFGGSVTGDLRFSIQWNESGNDNVDLDAHCRTSTGHEIYYGDKYDGISLGELDVDIQRPNTQVRGSDKTAVENITWPNRHRMPDGNYRLFVEQYSGTLRDGFKAEIEFDGQIYEFDYPHVLNTKQQVDIAIVTVKNGNFTIKNCLNSNSSVSSQEVWGLNTNQFIPVSVIMYSPNYWDDQNGIGNKHYFFMAKGCVNPETPNGFYNEFLNNELNKHKRVMEALGTKLAVVNAEDQLSGFGFSSTRRSSIIVKVKGKTERTLKVNF